MRSYPIKYGFFLNEFDPYFDYRASKFIVDNGLDAYWKWHDTMSWFPEGRDVPKTSQSGLHIVGSLSLPDIWCWQLFVGLYNIIASYSRIINDDCYICFS